MPTLRGGALSHRTTRVGNHAGLQRPMDPRPLISAAAGMGNLN